MGAIVGWEEIPRKCENWYKKHMTKVKLAAIEKSLPPLPKVGGTYVHAVRTGNLLYLAGKGVHVSGKVGREFTKEQGYAFARETGQILLAAIKQEIGSLRHVKRVVKVLGMVNAIPEFGDHPFVINGCSDLFVEVFGEAGHHARSAVGMSSLPYNIPVEIEAIVEVAAASRRKRSRRA
jgi:enamine deaminase RidA (YjgF/YER057c/UK114 family)